MVAFGGALGGLPIGAETGFYFVAVLRPMFVLDLAQRIPLRRLAPTVVLLVIATAVSTVTGSRLANPLEPTEPLRDESGQPPARQP